MGQGLKDRHQLWKVILSVRFVKHNLQDVFGLYRENQAGYQSDDVIPMGVVPVHEKKM